MNRTLNLEPTRSLRLYYTEPWLRRFDAKVVETAADGPRQKVWLDRTAFYPTSGGQPFDTGTLNQLRVVDVADGEDGSVVHVIEGTLAVGDEVAAEIDWPRRFDHMQQHTGQHILSAAFERLHQVRTESFRLGAECSTIDLAREVTAAEIDAAEDDANRIGWEGRPVSIRFVSEEEAGRLPLRKEPVRGGRLRLIDIEGYDLSACGGTHVSRTGEVGLIAVRGWERFRAGTRVEFVCGLRALSSYRAWREAAGGAARLLSATPGELVAAVARLQEDVKDARRATKLVADKATALEAASLIARADSVGSVALLVEAFEGYDLSAVKSLAGSFVKEPGRVFVGFTTTTPIQTVLMRSAGVEAVDCAAVLEAMTARFGGRGGGKSQAAQGGGLQGEPPALLAAARDVLRAMLGVGRLRT